MGSSNKPINLPASTLYSLSNKFTVHFHQIESSGLKEQRQTHISLEQRDPSECRKSHPTITPPGNINKLQLKALRQKGLEAAKLYEECLKKKPRPKKPILSLRSFDTEMSLTTSLVTDNDSKPHNKIKPCRLKRLKAHWRWGREECLIW